MLDLLAVRGMSFAYHDYHENAFGLYDAGPIDESRANRPLIELLTRKLHAPATVGRAPRGTSLPGAVP